MEKIRNLLGKTLLVASFIFFLFNSLIIVSDGIKKEDLFGFTIPEPSRNIVAIPYLGSMIGFIFEFISLHGLFTIFISLIVAWFGFLIKTQRKEEIRNPHTFDEDLNKRIKQVYVRNLIVKSLEETKDQDNSGKKDI